MNRKLIITGPVGAGKTTAVEALSDVPPVRTEQSATDETRQLKSNTTVAMDYGLMRLEDGGSVHIYATPGQERFGFMWEILVEGGIGLIVLIDNAREDPFADLDFFLESFSEFLRDGALAVGVTRMDQQREPSMDQYRSRLFEKGLVVPLFEVDARNGEDVKQLVRALLHSVAPGLLEAP